jgi:transcriptional regulator with XRE-family HTH domain
MDKDEKNIIPPNQLRNFRIEAKLSQSDVAFLLDIKNSGRISEWENGLSNPSLEHLVTLGLIFNRLPDSIYFELRKKLATKLEFRKKLLNGLKDCKSKRDEYG